MIVLESIFSFGFLLYLFQNGFLFKSSIVYVDFFWYYFPSFLTIIPLIEYDVFCEGLGSR